MDRQQRHYMVIGIAVLTAAVASAGVYLAISRIPVREVEVAKRFMVVAARPLPTGVLLTTKDVRLVAWPAGSMIAGGFSNIDAVVNRGLLASVVENEPLVDAKLAHANSGGGLPPSIPPGMRAMSVKVNDVVGVAGFIDPGTRVDVVVTMRKRDESTSRTVVSNVQVLTSGTRADQQQKPKEGKVPTHTPVVTLLVSPEDVERVALAQAEGQIVLVLRNPLDNETTATSGVRTAGLFGEAAPAAAEPVAPAKTRVRHEPAVVPAVAAPPPSKIYTVEAIRAAKRTEEVVR
jgi:pilus assembly protein CpaB